MTDTKSTRAPPRRQPRLGGAADKPVAQPVTPADTEASARRADRADGPAAG